MLDALLNLIRELEDCNMNITIDKTSSINAADLRDLAELHGDVLVSDRKGGFIIRAPARVVGLDAAERIDSRNLAEEETQEKPRLVGGGESR